MTAGQDIWVRGSLTSISEAATTPANFAQPVKNKNAAEVFRNGFTHRDARAWNRVSISVNVQDIMASRS